MAIFTILFASFPAGFVNLVYYLSFYGKIDENQLVLLL